MCVALGIQHSKVVEIWGIITKGMTFKISNFSRFWTNGAPVAISKSANIGTPYLKIGHPQISSTGVDLMTGYCCLMQCNGTGLIVSVMFTVWQAIYADTWTYLLWYLVL